MATRSRPPAALAVPSGALAPGEILDEAWSRLAASTRRAYAEDLDDFLRFVGRPSARGDGTLLAVARSVRPDHVSRWRRALEGRGCARATVARRLSAVRAVFDALIESRLIPGPNPAAGRRFRVSPGGASPARRSPGRGPVLAVLRSVLADARAGSPVAARNAAILSLMAFSGARASDVRAATLAAFRSGRPCPGGARVVVVRRKGGRERGLTMNPLAVAWTVRWVRRRGRRTARRDEPLYGTEAGRPLSDSAIRKALLRASARAGVSPALRPHQLRHFCATEALSAGATVEQVRALLGHASERTTRLYDDAVREAKAWRSLAGLMREATS